MNMTKDDSGYGTYDNEVSKIIAQSRPDFHKGTRISKAMHVIKRIRIIFDLFRADKLWYPH